ncbi:MAG TPA: nitrous oxide reductase accessory protein NosL [Gemmatimonadaceae bacterium]|nr:nitrous oxide reductase accessory protein NosL [Gemmatimonadaceae bacterium]
MRRRSVWIVTAAWLAACRAGPRPLVPGTDSCDFCRMTIADVRFGGEIVTGTGRVYTFDSIECLASFYLQAERRDAFRGVWVSDYSTGVLIPVERAEFLAGSTIKSPMGRALLAVSRDSLDALRQRFQAEPLSWANVLEMLSKGSG